MKYWHWLCCLLTLSLMAFCPCFQPRLQVFSTPKRSASSVCTTGQIITGSSEVNYLPQGYWGNAPDRGMVEIGGQAGNPWGEKKPSLHSDASKRMWFGITFKEDILSLGSDQALPLGLSLDFDDSQGHHFLTVQKETTHFSDLFTLRPPQDYYACSLSLNDLLPLANFFAKSFDKGLTFHFVGITLAFTTDFRLNDLQLRYGFDPATITNVVLSDNLADFSAASVSYPGESCQGGIGFSAGTAEPIALTSQYGYLLSKDFFQRTLLADSRFLKDTQLEFEDPQGYFLKGRTAELLSTFPVKMAAVDQAGKIVEWSFIITIVDTEAPVVHLTQDNGAIIKTDYHGIEDPEAFIASHFAVWDNADSHPSLSLCLTDGSELPLKTIGWYHCFLIAKDSSAQETRLPFLLILNDDTPPVITSKASDITLSPNSQMGQAEILDNFTAYDEIDGALSLKVTQNQYQEQWSTPGDYLFSVEAMDQSYNVATASLTLHVRDQTGASWYSNKTMFTFTQGEIPSLSQISESLINEGILPDIVYTSFEQMSGDSLDNTLTVGLHSIRLRFHGGDGTDYDIDLTVKVLSPQETSVTETSDSTSKKRSFWQAICDFFASLWEWIRNLFTHKKS
jgi:hypothetical protein